MRSVTPTSRRDLPRDADEALRFAIKLAVDEGDFDRAALLVDAAKRTMKKSASVTPLAVVRDEHDRKA